MKYKLSDLRIDYEFEGLDENKIDEDPFLLFDIWFKDALEKKVFEPNGMIIATADSDGKPSARVVLLKDISKGGFVSYTHYTSRKERSFKIIIMPLQYSGEYFSQASSHRGQSRKPLLSRI